MSDDSPEQIDAHDVLLALNLGAEIALEVADVADLDVNLFEALGRHFGDFSFSGGGKKFTGKTRFSSPLADRSFGILRP